jgi:hypothetical protein
VIQFHTDDEGMPTFDLVPNPHDVKLDDMPVESPEVDTPIDPNDPQRGMENFLTYWWQKLLHETITVETLRSDLEEYSGLSLEQAFKVGVYNSPATGAL